jgi:hypothetical protein
MLIIGPKALPGICSDHCSSISFIFLTLLLKARSPLALLQATKEEIRNKIIPTRKVSVRTVPSEKYLGKGFSIRAVRIQIKEHPQRG